MIPINATKKQLTPFNAKFKPHGYWEIYYDNDIVKTNGYFINGEKIGLWNNYFFDGQLLSKRFYIL